MTNESRRRLEDLFQPAIDAADPETAEEMRSYLRGVESDVAAAFERGAEMVGTPEARQQADRVRTAMNLGARKTMPISLADLKNHRATVNVNTPLGPVEVTYLPNALTPAKEAEMAQLARIGDDDEDADIRDHAMIHMFCQLVDSIDLAGPVVDEAGDEIVGAGELIPVDPDYVVYIPSPILMATFAAIRAQTEEEAERHSKSSKNGAKLERIDSRRGSLGRRDR